MSKKILLFLLIFILGGAAGYFTNQYFNVLRPQKLLVQEAKKQQQELEQMMISGKVVALKSNELTIDVITSGNPNLKNKIITITTDHQTNIQKGTGLLENEAGKAVDLTKYLNTGTQVDALVMQDKALAVHWDAPGGPEPPKIRVN